MKLSVKKFSKKSLSLLIALIMVFSALPLTPPISADAATSTISMTAMACFKNGDANRVGDTYISVCNDGKNSNFVMAIFNFDVTGITVTDLDDVSAIFNYYYQRTQNENKGFSFYYPTQNLSEFDVENRSATQPNTSIWSGDDSGHLTRAINYYQLKELATNIATPNQTKTNARLDIGPAIKYAKSVGNSVATAVAVIASPGQSDSSGGGWTDTSIGYTSDSVSVTVTEKTLNSQQYKDYINSRINSWSLPNSETVAYYGTNVGVTNVLYSSNTFIDNTFSEFALSEKQDDTLMRAKVMAGAGRIVYMYTGDKSVAKIPLIAETDRQSSVLKRYKLNYISSATSNWKFTDKWYATTAWNSWTASNTNGEDGAYSVYADSSHNTTDYTSNSGGITSDGGWNFRNLAVYNGSVSFSNNYMKLTNPTIDMSFDGYCTWRGGGGAVNNISKSTSFADYNVPVFNMPSDASYYMIDFSTMKNMYSTVKTNYNNIISEESKYTDESLYNYYKAVAEIISFNAKGYAFSTDANVQQCALDLNNVIASYNNAYKNLELKNVTVEFQRVDLDGTDLTPETIRTVEIKKGSTVAAGYFPELKATHYEKDNKHYVYYWNNNSTNTEFTSDTIVNSNIVVEQKRRLVACTYDSNDATCMSKAVCKVCGEPVGDLKPHSYTKATFVDSVGNDNSYTKYTCTMCGQEDETVKAREYTDQSEYWNTYRTLLAQAKDKIAENEATNGAKYNSDTIDALNEAIARVTDVGDEKKSQTYIENENTILQTAITAVKLNQYSITVKYVDENSELGTDTITNVDYGTIKDVTAKTNFENKDYVVYKWTRSTQAGDKLFGLNSTSISVNVIGDLTYYVHLKSTQAESPTDTAVVTLNNKAGKPVDIGYVTTNVAQDVVVNGNTIQIGTTTTLTAPQYSFYDIKGFIVNGELITANSGTKSITVTEDMSIIPLYSPTDYVEITRNSAETFTINGKDIGSYSAKWDELITLESTGDVIWCTAKGGSEVVLGQGASMKFRANEAIEIYTKPTGETLSPISRVGYFGYDADLKKVTIVNNFFVPGGANQNVKAGVVVSTKEKTRDELIAQYNAGSLKFEGGYDKFTADKNQLRISINRSGSGDFSMWALSYVVVGNTTYYASEVSTYTYNSSATA